MSRPLDSISFAVAGISATASALHYVRVALASHSPPAGPVPLHFGWSGVPSMFAPQRWFAVYPLLVAVEGACMVLVCPASRLDRLVLANAMASTVAAQMYASLVSTKQVLGMPRWLPKLLTVQIVVPAVLSLLPPT